MIKEWAIISFQISAVGLASIFLCASMQGCVIGDDQLSQDYSNLLDLDVPLSIPPPVPARGPSPAVSWSRIQSPPLQSLDYICSVIGDINLDGHMDIVAGYANLGIHIWKGNSNGGWTSFPSPSINQTFNDIEIGDINNDGKPDLVCASTSGLHAWTGNANGTWTSASPSGGGRPFFSVDLGDINLDGNLDIVAGTRAMGGPGGNKAIWVFLGNGAGGWSRGDASLPTVGEYHGVSLGDFNRDGLLDIAASGGNGVNAWIGNGAGNWTLRNSGLVSSGVYSNLKMEDFNHDGKLDIVSTNSMNGGIKVWNGDGWGIWTLTFDLPTTGNYFGVEVADFNLDGYQDIVTASGNSDVAFWSGDGLDNWYPQMTGFQAGNNNTKISSGDLTNDGRLEICMINNTGQLDIWKCSIERPFNTWADFPAPNTAGTVNDIMVWDVNMDGKKDICYAFETKGIEIWTGNGNGTWAAFTSPATTGNYNSLATADFNKDGKPDLIATSDTGTKAWIGNGAGTWTARASGLPPLNIQGLSLADFNDDGNPDIATGSGVNTGITVYNGDGWGTWTMTFGLLITGNYISLDSADVNNDGNLDIIGANGGIKVFLGNSNGGWTDSSSGLPGSTSQYNSVEAVDINGDAREEIIGTSAVSGTTVWKRGSTGIWSLDSTILSSNSNGLAQADFNLDGKNDVCVGSSQNAGISAFVNYLTCWDNESANLSTSGAFTTMDMADINIDGFLDIITYNNTAQSANIWIADYEAPPVINFNIGPLSVGWNLISNPLVPLAAQLPEALVDLDADTTWTVVKYYDSTDVLDPWKSHCRGRPGGQDLTEIGEHMGIWLYIPNVSALGDGLIRVSGNAPGTTSIMLKTGWNLVGYPSATSRLASLTLPGQADRVSAWQAASPYVVDYADKSLVTMSQGNAYWVRVTADCVWNVDY
jgi:hypothetical protein